MNKYRMLELSVEITHDCVDFCNFCSSDARCVNRHSTNSEQPQRILSLETIKNLLVEGKQCGAKDFSLSGGEPFCHPDIWQIMDYAQSLDYNLLFYTSGSMLNNEKEIIPITDEAIRRLQSYKSLTMIFDTQGVDEKRVDDLMGADGAFENITTSIKKCVAAKLRTESHFVPMRPNIKYLFETVDFLEDLGVSKVSYLRFVPQGRGRDKTMWELTKRQFEDLQYILIRLDEEKRRIKIRAGHPIDMRFLVDPKYPIRKCRGGMSAPLIQPTESGAPLMVMCPGWKDLKEYAAGSVGNPHSLTELWNNSDTYKIFRWFIYEEGYKEVVGACKDCPWLYQCRAGCLAARLIHNVPKGVDLKDAIKMSPDPLCFWDGI